MIKNKKLYLVMYPDKDTEYWYVTKNQLFSQLSRLKNLYNDNIIYSEITNQKILKIKITNRLL